MPRQEYKVETEFNISLDDERLTDVQELLEARFNEFLGKLERNDDVRINLLCSFEVTEIK